VGTTEDGGTVGYRFSAGGTGPVNVVDDAVDVRLFYLTVPKWPGSILGDFKCY